MNVGHSVKLLRYKIGRKDSQVSDDAYKSAEERFLQHVVSVQQTLQSLRAFSDSLKDLGAVSKALGEHVWSYYRLHSARSAPRGADVFREGMRTIESETTAAAVEGFDGNIVREWEEYNVFLTSLKSRIVERKQLLSNFEYYRNKVLTLRQRGSKDPGQLPRNEAKLFAAQQAYEVLNQELTEVFLWVVDEAPTVLHPVLHGSVTCITQLLSRVSRGVEPMRSIVERPDENECEYRDLPRFKSYVDQYGPMKADASGNKYLFQRSFKQQSSSMQPPHQHLHEQQQQQQQQQSQPGRSMVRGQPAEYPDYPSHNPEFEEESPRHVSGQHRGGKHSPPSDNEQEQELESGQLVQVTHNYRSANQDELNLVAGEKLTLLKECEEGWWRARNSRGNVGLIPYNFVQPC